MAVNGKYAAFASDDAICIVSLIDSAVDITHVQLPRALSCHHLPVLALFNDQPDVLVAACGHAIHIYDLPSANLRSIIPGTGRIITAIALSDAKPEQVVSTHIDSSICVWDLRHPEQPLRWVPAAGATCNAISRSSGRFDLLATVCDDGLRILDLSGATANPTWPARDTKLTAIAWNPQFDARLAVSTSDGQVQIYDCSPDHAACDSISLPYTSDDDGDGGVFGEPEDYRSSSQSAPIVMYNLETRLKAIRWVGADTLLALSEDGLKCILFEMNIATQEHAQLWSCAFESAVESCALIKVEHDLVVVGIASERIDTRVLPDDIAGRLQADQSESSVSPASTANIKPATRARMLHTSIGNSREAGVKPTMTPLSILQARVKATAFEKTSKQLQRRLLPRHRSGQADTARTEANAGLDKPTSQSSTPRTSMSITSTQKASQQADNGSPMPFLSPSVPAKIPPVDYMSLQHEVLMPPPSLPHPSFASVPSSSAVVSGNSAESDDSDDEAFGSDMHGRAAFLPGGINVPLPKACGALFAPNGQLLTFFPPKHRPPSRQVDAGIEERAPRQASKGDRATRLFQVFGVLEDMSGDESSSTESTSDQSTVADEVEGASMSLPNAAFQSASPTNRLSVQRQSLVAHSPEARPSGTCRVVVNVHEVEDVAALCPRQRSLAAEYQMIRDADTSRTEVCEQNANVAGKAELHDIAEVWRALAIMLKEENSTDEVHPSLQATGLNATSRGLDNDQRYDLLSTPKHPLRGPWLAESILSWADKLADIQSMACFACILSKADDRIRRGSQVTTGHFPQRDPNHSVQRSARQSTFTSPDAPFPKMPILGTYAATVTSLKESPTKVSHGSSSPAHSQPQPRTSFPGSHSFTPPSMSRQSTQQSSGGSASPEYQRGSFTATAKLYAQSITDKFTSYGTSPPYKKSSVSPTPPAELSSSLPAGSWPGKSVSFASIATDDSLQRSLSVSAQTPQYAEDDGYDSDKTIEDTSLPHTPKGSSAIAVTKLFHLDSFLDDEAVGTVGNCIPDDMTEAVRSWNQYYAELLRSWEMLDQASELDKIAGATTTDVVPTLDGSVVPAAMEKQRTPTCAICVIATKGLMQLCAACLHCSHLPCLKAFSEALEGADFTCPSGCGCSCSQLPFVSYKPMQQSPPRVPFRKKASFTDPSRWRARVEGDSW